jgi:hypothetical protein
VLPVKRNFHLHLLDIIFTVAFMLGLVSGAQMLSSDSDLGRHLTLGNYILDYRIIPTRDLFSHTLLGQPRPPYEWLSQILFALSHRLLNLDGGILFSSIIIAATFTLTFQFANRRSRSLIIAMIVTFLAVGASSLHWLPRPHIITFLLLAIWIEKLELLRKGEPVTQLMHNGPFGFAGFPQVLLDHQFPHTFFRELEFLLLHRFLVG